MHAIALVPILMLSVLCALPCSAFAEAERKGSSVELTLDDSGWGDWFQFFWNDWETRNVTKATSLVLFTRVLEGDASEISVCISDDAETGAAVRVGNYGRIGKDWTRIEIPLADLAGNKERIKSVILQRSAGAKTVIAVDEIQFIGAAPQVLWGESAQHEAMQATGGTQVEHRIVP